MTSDTATKSEARKSTCEVDADGNFSIIVRSNQGWLRAAAGRQLNGNALADDVVQSVFIALWSRYQPPHKDEPRLRSWLARTMRHICRNIAIGERRRKTRERNAALLRREDGHGREQPVVRDQRRITALEDALKQLPDADLAIVLATFYQGQKARQIAYRLGISEAAARKRAARAVNRLRRVAYANYRKTDRKDAVLTALEAAILHPLLGLKSYGIIRRGSVSTRIVRVAYKALFYLTYRPVTVAAAAFVVAGASVAVPMVLKYLNPPPAPAISTRPVDYIPKHCSLVHPPRNPDIQRFIASPVEGTPRSVGTRAVAMAAAYQTKNNRMPATPASQLRIRWQWPATIAQPTNSLHSHAAAQCREPPQLPRWHDSGPLNAPNPITGIESKERSVNGLPW